MKQLAQKVFVQGVAAVGPFLVLPVVSRASGEGEWSAFVLGQTVGLLVGVLASFGWPVSGISTVSRAGSEDRRKLFLLSITTRLLAFACYMPLALVLLHLLSGTDFFIAAFVSFGVAFSAALNMSWYFVAVGTPLKSLLYGVAPVLAAAGTTCALVLSGFSVAVHGVTLFVATVVMLVIASAFECGADIKLIRFAMSGRSILDYYRRNVAMSGSQIISAVYVASPMFFATSLLSPPDADGYATANRVMVISTTLVMSSGSVLQAWVSMDKGDRRARTASIFTLGIGALGGVTFAIFGRTISSVVFGADLAVTRTVALMVGSYIVLTAARVVLQRYYLIPRGEYGSVLIASCTGFAFFFMAVLAGAFVFAPATVPLLLLCVLLAEAGISGFSMAAVFCSVRVANRSNGRR